MANLPLYPHRQIVYFGIGFGWSTDRQHDRRVNNGKS